MNAVTSIITAVLVYAIIKLIGAKIAWGDAFNAVKVAMTCIQSVWW